MPQSRVDGRGSVDRSRLRCELKLLFFFNDTATTEIYTLALHDALPIWRRPSSLQRMRDPAWSECDRTFILRSEEHTSELQSRQYLVCRLLLEKKQPL